MVGTHAAETGRENMTTIRVRVFQGKDTKQETHDGRPASPERWYWEPADYEGDALWTSAFPSRESAEMAARDYEDNLPEVR